MSFAAVAIIIVLIALIYCVQVQANGQTLGHKLTRTRVLDRDALQPPTFARALLRLAGFRRGVHTFDIREHDPLAPATKVYPLYPEEWVSEAQLATLEITPAPAPRWSAAFAGDEPSVPHSADSTPRRTPGLDPAQQRRARRREHVALTLRAAATLACVFAVFGLTVAVAALLQPAGTVHNQREFLAQTLDKPIPVRGWADSGVPDYAPTPAWSHQASPGATVTASAEHVYLIDNRTLTVLSAETGAQVAAVPLTGSITASAQTDFGGRDGLFWSVGQTAYGWTPGTDATGGKSSTGAGGAKGGKPASFSATIPKGAKPYIAGKQLLFIASADSPTNAPAGSQPNPQGDFRAWSFEEDGFHPISVPRGYTPGSVDGTRLVSTNADGNVQITEGKNLVTSYALDKPKANTTFAGTLATGYGRIAALFSPLPDSENPSTPVTIAVYQADTGKLLSYMDTTRGAVGDSATWEWGTGGELGTYGNFLFNTATGKPLLNAQAQQLKFVDVAGEGAVGSGSNGPVFIHDSHIYSISSTRPIMVTPHWAIARSKAGKISMYHQK